MKVSDLIKELQNYGTDKDVTVFTEGNLYPTLEVSEQVDDPNVVVVGCGWTKLGDKDDFNYGRK